MPPFNGAGGSAVCDNFDALTKSQVPTTLTPFAQELDALRARLVAETKADNGRADRRHLAKIHAARWLCAIAGLGSAWICVNPASAFLVSMFRFVSWSMCAHHILHRGYDGVPGIPVQWTSARYARGWRRWVDWPDWIWPDAWIQEHNTLHHYKLGETHDPANYHVALGDPDLVEFNLEWLRKSSAPWPLKYTYIFVMACIWKFLYYAPNTLHAWLLKKDPSRKLPKALDLAFIQPFGSTGRMLWSKCYLPYVALNFVAIPAAFLLISRDAACNVLLNMLAAEVMTNLHAFVTIVTNHAGDDLHRFSEPLSPQMTRHDFYCRQIMGSVNFPCGNDLIDTMHGYLNDQIEHHLWPDMTMLQYRKAQPLVKALAAKYGVSYVQESALLRTLKTVRIMAGVSDQKRLPNTVNVGRAPQ